MSGIAGLLRFDDKPVSRRELERIANALRTHGPDRSDVAALGRIGLVHVLMRMTPEDLDDRQPHQGKSGAVITADLRLDNRDEMLRRIGLSPQEALSWPDSRIVLNAWETFGDTIWPMLRGPFAVAIWDPRTRTLTLARDHLGLNVVMWHRSERFFAFATMPNGLFALEDVPRQLNEEKFADFLVLNHADHATTMYRDVFRVRPAHVMHVSAEGAVRQDRFWSPRDVKAVLFRTDEDYAAALRDCLDTAVRRQMRSAHPIGCLLSGGLDSSSVAALAARALAAKNQRLAAFTGVPRAGFRGPAQNGHYADERPYVEAIAETIGNIDVTYVTNESGEDLADVERFFIALEGPVRNPTNLGWVLAILRLARAQGRRVLLGGLRGNSTISWNGWSQAADHLKSGRWLTAFRQWHLYYRHTPHSRLRAAKQLFVDPILPGRFADLMARMRDPAGRAPWQQHAPIRPEFAAEAGVDARARRDGHDFHYRGRRNERFESLMLADYAGDWNAAEKALTGVEIRDPTADIDVVSYCFGIPPEQYLAEGIDRSLIRRAMWGLLPEKVLTNRLHGMQDADWFERIGGQRDALARDIATLAQSPLARRAIDLPRLERALANWPTDGWDRPDIFVEYNLALMRGVAAGRFLRWFESANR
ncbi:asparagine synthase-related protein [Pseudorhodoplanes sp.]|uniref:asparagine synthase-related protein n=1 Tax=Pseudorhodoplanes sp. TaxID=1934341 RepID=UPI002CBDC5B3|nr:asparagine synthase-related protein [Pseudorhodoplanes sp.]HWV42895.1 asparagine synthase-related protein [Pseudorhodoplanes sp.]